MGRDLTKRINVPILSPAAVAYNARMDRHTILEIRFREEDQPELNYILCDCGWRGAPVEFPVHRAGVLKERREEAQRAMMEAR